MSRRGAGISLVILAAILFAIRNSVHYIGAATLAARNGSYSSETMEQAIDWTATPYSIAPEIISLIVGIAFIVWSEIDTLKKWMES